MATTIKAASSEHLLTALEQLADSYRTFAPTSEDGATGFRPLDRMTAAQRQAIAPLAFDNKPTVGSIKSLFFPDSEAYIQFRQEGQQVFHQPIEDGAPQIVLGAKTCDIKSIELLDKVFLAAPVDGLYRDKREKTVIIGTACTKLGTNCSCDQFGIAPVAAEADLVMAQNEQGEVRLTAQTARGEQLAAELLAVGGLAEDEPYPLSANAPPAQQLAPEQVQLRMDQLFDSPLWDKLAMTCLGCGACTYYCPTCHCYDIRDFNRKDRGVRYRTWDSCMFASFTNMAGGHNPRPTRKDRLRNRFFHKLNYFVKKQGELGCVGCGRCAELCPAGISINRVLQEIGGELHVQS